MLQRRPLLILGCAIYLIVLHLAYVLVLMPGYEHRGFSFDPRTTTARLLCYGLSLAPAFWLPVTARRPSQVVYWLLYLMLLVPACLVPLYALRTDPWQIALWSGVLVGSFLLLGAIYLLPLPRLRLLAARPGVFWIGIGLLAGSLFVYLAVSRGLSFELAPLLEAYDVRAEYRESTTGEYGVGYAVGWLGYVAAPLLIAHGLIGRRWIVLLLGVALELELYAMTGYKSLLFAVPLLLATYLALAPRGRNFGPAAAWGACALVALATTASLLLEDPLPGYFVVGRPIAVPGLLTGYYFDFFSQNEQARLGHSVLAFMGDYGYEAAPPYVIGEEYYGNPRQAANAGVWADGYANFGYAGVLAATVALGAVLWLIDALAAGVGDFRPALILSGAGFVLANSGLLTALMTHGLLLTMLVIYFMPRTRGQSRLGRGQGAGGRGQG